MELFLNTAWAFLALAGVGLWVRYGRKERGKWCFALTALTMLIVLIFPVISVSDDLYAIQNQAETDSLGRRHEMHAAPPVLLATGALPEAAFAGILMRNEYRGSVPLQLLPSAGPRVDDALQNRPPPAA